MIVTKQFSVSSCRSCPDVTNTTKEHDDPFTSAPHPTIWYCTLPNGPKVISDPTGIHQKCPHLKGQ